WQTVIGLPNDPHGSWLHLASIVLILAALALLGVAWWVVYRAQRRGRLAMRGPYALVRHPQYAAFVVILAAFLLQWPTLLTLLMFPVLVIMYVGLARREEREVRAVFGAEYDRYAAATPAFITWPRHRRRPTSSSLARGELT
ncbi:MAG: isoprenylcysteine carboxylmethyltransferase family protein, partial [Gemmatimonadetes bacterium]|nr:isoprenylcysteine carboxylmethyltransferase family protein [Gemmatimonadota bacterium]